MNTNSIDTKVLLCANYYIENKSTVRAVGKHFGISKSQVHIYLTVHLKKLNKNLYIAARKILDENKKERSLRAKAAILKKHKTNE